jgi:hypothetical protein
MRFPQKQNILSATGQISLVFFSKRREGESIVTSASGIPDTVFKLPRYGLNPRHVKPRRNN